MMPPEQVFELFSAVGYLAPRAGVLPHAEACASFPVALLVREA